MLDRRGLQKDGGGGGRAHVTPTAEVVVVGAGPAGLAAAAALGETGLQVTITSPAASPEEMAPWPNTYGVWYDELEPLGYAPLLGRTWTDTRAHFGRGEVALGRTYGRVDNARLQRHLLERCERSGVRWRRAHVVGARHTASGSQVLLEDGTVLTARLILDTSGHFPVLVERPVAHASGKTPAKPPAFQTAYGVLGSFSAPPIPAGQMCLMDYRDDFLTPAEQRGDPTFLYAMDMGGGRFFVEETSLARRPGLPLEVLRNRLQRRLVHMGVTREHTLELEHCAFPMGLPLPDLEQRVVGFGGAASMVHPASGYMLASVLRSAPELARAVAEGLGRQDATPQRTAEAAWRTLWSDARVRQRQLYLFGLESILTLHSAQLQDFFSAFFNLSARRWQGYLSGTLSAPEIALSMSAMFAHAPNRVRLPLIRTALGREGALLLRALRCP